METLKAVEQEFYLRIKNNTAAKQNVVLFDVVNAYQNQNGAAGGSSDYVWDIIAELIQAGTSNADVLALLAAPISTGIYTVLYYTNPAGDFSTAAEVVAGLNSFGIGTFTNAGTIISTTNNIYLLSSISLCVLFLAVAINSADATFNGSLIYDAGYSTGLVGNFTRINTSNPFWINPSASTTDGPLNRCMIDKNAVGPVDQSLRSSFFLQIDSPSAKTVYMGAGMYDIIFCNATVHLNNVLVWTVPFAPAQIPIANNVNSILGTAYDANTIMSKLWHIVPINLKAGINIIQIDAVSPVGIEVYDNTAAEIAAATSYADLNLLASSIDYVGKQLF